MCLIVAKDEVSRANQNYRRRWLAILSQRGSHQQFKHPAKLGRVTVAGKPGADVHPKTLATILRQAQIG
jgi:predicted RNA binding protein YcfA (HicA-like mRNA interferase family)